MDKGQLAAVIDRLVEDAIRRILPGVMNEVLLQTIAGAGLVLEGRARPIRRRKPVKRRSVPPVEERPTRRVPPRRRVDLNEMLDDSVGSDAYEKYEARVPGRPRARTPEPEVDDCEPVRASPLARKLSALDPSLQAMAEGLDIPDDDGGEMWAEGENDAVATGPIAVSEVRDVSAAAQRAGMDFSKMREVIERTSRPKPADSEDARARALFEAQRLKRMRERLNDGKPVD